MNLHKASMPGLWVIEDAAGFEAQVLLTPGQGFITTVGGVQLTADDLRRIADLIETQGD